MQGVVMAALVGLGIYFTNNPYESGRPAIIGGRPLLHVGNQNIPARLWEDPLERVARAFPPKPDEQEVPGFLELGEVVGIDGEEAIAPKADFQWEKVLCVFLPMGPYPEDQESRLRTRYAVLSALSMEGFAPFQENALGGIRYRFRGPDGVVQRTTLLAFEEFSDDHDDKVAVVWIPMEVFETEDLLDEVHTLCLNLRAGLNLNDHGCFSLIGPTRSAYLTAMIEQDEKWNDTVCPSVKDCVFQGGLLVSPWATAETTSLAKIRTQAAKNGKPFINAESPGSGNGIPSLTLRCGLQLVRTIGTDDELITRLEAELKARGLTESSNLALLSEWGNPYAEDLAKAFHSGTRFSYFLGIDGRVPETLEEAASLASQDRGNLEKPAGESQIDYIRRLQQQLLGQDKGFEAIGVVGADMYDKLLLIQALRDVFPDAVVFTTDLDARFFTQEDYGSHRNLLIASHHPLEVEPTGAGMAVFPFRESYQVAVYLATQIGLNFSEMNRFDLPMDSVGLYEVGRTGPVKLSHKKKDEPIRHPVAWFQCMLPLLGILSLHAGRRSLPSFFKNLNPGIQPAAKGAILKTWRAAFLVLFVGFLIVSWNAGVGSRWELNTSNFMSLMTLILFGSLEWLLLRRTRRELAARRLVVGSLSGIAAVWVLLMLILLKNYLGESAEPITLIEGVSIWPTVFLRGAVFAVSLVAVTVLICAQEVQEQRIGRFFHLDSSNRHQTLMQGLKKVVKGIPDFLRGGPLLKGIDLKGVGDPLARQDKAWTWYRELSAARATRSLVATLLFAGALGLSYFTGRNRFLHARGDWAHYAESWSWSLSLLGVAWLMFLTLDTTILCRMFLGHFASGRCATPFWSDREIYNKHGEPQYQVDQKPLADQLDAADINQLKVMRFAGELTESVGRMAWYPFVLISVLMLSQNAFFENWSWTWSTVALFAILMTGVLIAVVSLRKAAERLRSTALRELRETLLRHRMKNQTSKCDELTQAIEEAKGMRQGAFLPLAEHPAIAALLVPFGGAGMLALLEVANS